MSLALTVTDFGDGTGGSATIAGSDGGQTVTLFWTPYANLTGALNWTALATRTGNGTIALTLPVGAYFFYVAGIVSSSPAVSNIAFAFLTTTTPGVHSRCLDAYQSIITLLPLAQMPKGNIVQAWTPDGEGVLNSRPGVVICPMGNENQPGVLNGRDDIDFPVLVSMVDNKEGYQANIPRNTLWRQQIFRSFRNQRLPGVQEIITTTVVTNPVIDARWWAAPANLWYSSLLFKPRSRELRGVGS